MELGPVSGGAFFCGIKSENRNDIPGRSASASRRRFAINGQFETITSSTDKGALRISYGQRTEFRGSIYLLQNIDIPSILSWDVGRVLGTVQVKSRRSRRTVVNGTAMILAIVNNIFSLRKSRGSEETYR